MLRRSLRLLRNQNIENNPMQRNRVLSAQRFLASRVRFKNTTGVPFLMLAPKRLDVPIGQPNATVGFGLADLGRMRRAMDAVSLRGEPDPVRSRRVVRPGLDRERLFDFTPLNL